MRTVDFTINHKIDDKPDIVYDIIFIINNKKDLSLINDNDFTKLLERISITDVTKLSGTINSTDIIKLSQKISATKNVMNFIFTIIDEHNKIQYIFNDIVKLQHRLKDTYLQSAIYEYKIDSNPKDIVDRIIKSITSKATHVDNIDSPGSFYLEVKSKNYKFVYDFSSCKYSKCEKKEIVASSFITSYDSQIEIAGENYDKELDSI